MEWIWTPTIYSNLTRFCRAQTRTRRFGSIFSGVYLQVSFFVIKLKNDKIVRATRKLVSHPTQMYRCCPADKHDTGRIAGMSSGSQLDRSWWTAPIRAMDRFHPVHSLQWSLPREYMWSRRRLTKIQATSMSVNMWPEMWSGMSKQAQQKRRHWAEEKAKLAKMHQSWKVFITSIQKSRNSMKHWKMRERSWNYVWLERSQGDLPQKRLRTRMSKLAMSTSRKEF